MRTYHSVSRRVNLMSMVRREPPLCPAGAVSPVLRLQEIHLTLKMRPGFSWRPCLRPAGDKPMFALESRRFQNAVQAVLSSLANVPEQPKLASHQKSWVYFSGSNAFPFRLEYSTPLSTH